MRKQNILCCGLILMGIYLTPLFAIYDDTTKTLEKGDKAFSKGDYNGAIHYYTEAIAADPDNAVTYFSRASAYNNTHRFPKAIVDYTQSLKLAPDQASAYHFRAHSYDGKGDYASAIADYEKAISLRPFTQVETVAVYNDLAWLLATCPQKKFRDGKRAVENATAAWDTSLKRSSDVLETLAAAYAEAGDFAHAVKWEQQFLATLDLSDGPKKEAMGRLALYETGKPYREEQ